MTDDDIDFFDIDPKYQERLLKWFDSSNDRIRISTSTEGFTVSGGDKSETDASLEAALNRVIGYRGRRGHFDPDFEERVREWLTANAAMMTITRYVAGKEHQFVIELSAASRRGEATDEDFEVALVLAEDMFTGESSGTEESEPETLAAHTRHLSPRELAEREVEPPTREAVTRLFGGDDARTLAVPYSNNRGRMSYARNRRQTYGQWVADVSDSLELIGAHFDDASLAYWRQLYQAGFSPAAAVTEYGSAHREQLGLRANAMPPPAPSARRRGHESTLRSTRRLLEHEEALHRRDERPFDPEAPREHYAQAHHFAVNHSRHADKDILREVTLGDTGYVLVTWDTGKQSRGQTIIGYAFYAPGASTPLFEGDEFRGTPMRADDSDDALRSLLTFLTLRPGDTDYSYFGGYTPEQMAFAEGEAEELSMYAMSEPEYADDYPLVDVA